MGGKILILDDETDIADIIELYLANENFEIYKYYTAQEALECINKIELDLAILDVMLPDTNGFNICKKIREKYTYPIIMLTAKDTSIDKINGLTFGADDYITKPFDPLELVARVKAQLRRYKKYNVFTESKQDIIEYLGLVMNISTHQCILNGNEIKLTPTEFSILKILFQRKGTVVSSEELFHEIWKDEYYGEKNNSITVHIRNIRGKVNDSFENPRYIKTVWGIGYKIE